MRFGYALCSGLVRWSFILLFGLKVRGQENIQPQTKCILASNHRSNLDPMIMGGGVRREIHFFAKIELFKNRILGGLIRYLNAFPVTRSGFDRKALNQSREILNQDGALLIFPEGTRAPSGGFLRAKIGIGWVACLTDAPIIPVYIHGSEHPWRALFRRPRISIVIGAPVSLSELASPELPAKERYQRISEETVERIRTLSLETPGQVVKEKGPIYQRDVIPYPHLR